jgi:Protein of unknown function (DUF2924)
MAKRSADLAAIEVEIERIRSLDLDALRAEWRKVFKRTQPSCLTKDILGRMIAYRLQERVLGGLDRQTAKMLDRLARGGKAAAELNRRLKPGTVLLREHQGERHEVTVTPDGYIWRGATFPSLSAIAGAITGTSWNGRRFFGSLVEGERTQVTGIRPSRRSGLHSSNTKPGQTKAGHPRRWRRSHEAQSPQGAALCDLYP